MSVWGEVLALQQCLCWWRERECLQNPVCQQPERETLPCRSAVHHGKCPKVSPYSPQPSFTPPLPSWSIFLFCREHRVPLDSHWKTTFNCCIESHRSSFTRFHLIHTTMLMVWNVWHCSSLVIIAVYIIKYEPFAAFRVVTMHNAYLLSDKNWHDDLQMWHDFDWTEEVWITSF